MLFFFANMIQFCLEVMPLKFFLQIIYKIVEPMSECENNELLFSVRKKQSFDFQMPEAIIMQGWQRWMSSCLEISPVNNLDEFMHVEFDQSNKVIEDQGTQDKKQKKKNSQQEKRSLTSIFCKSFSSECLKLRKKNDKEMAEYQEYLEMNSSKKYGDSYKDCMVNGMILGRGERDRCGNQEQLHQILFQNVEKKFKNKCENGKISKEECAKLIEKLEQFKEPVRLVMVDSLIEEGVSLKYFKVRVPQSLEAIQIQPEVRPAIVSLHEFCSKKKIENNLRRLINLIMIKDNTDLSFDQFCKSIGQKNVENRKKRSKGQKRLNQKKKDQNSKQSQNN